MIQTMWSWEPAIYLFLGGLAGGTFFVSALVRLITKDKFSRLATVAPWVSFIALAIGLLCLIIEVEKPLQAMMMWKSFVSFGSWMTIGAWLLFVSIVVFILCAAFSTPKIAKVIESAVKPLAKFHKGIVNTTLVVGGILGLCVAIYTGILLMSAHSIPLWNTPLIPVLFTISALDAGASVVVCCLLFEKNNGAKVAEKKLGIALLVLIVLEAGVLFFLLSSLQTGNASEVISSSTLISGDLSLPFWVLTVTVGLGVPFVLTIVDLIGVVKRAEIIHLMHIAAIVCALIGGFTLRYVILAAGIHGVMVAPDAYMAALGISEIIL